MQIKPAHRRAFKEYLRDTQTNRLHNMAEKAAEENPLPPPKLVKRKKKGLFKRWKEDQFAAAIPIRWILCSVGRKERRLVVTLSLQWRMENHESTSDYELYEEPYPTFITDVVLYPLFPPQAAWVGARNLTSRNDYAIYWGTKEDWDQIQRECPALPIPI